MRGNRIVLTPGQRFGRYVVIERADCRSWLCKCDCGTVKAVYGAGLISGRNSGCIGCRPRPMGALTHGCSPRQLYHVWNGMRSRCHSPTNNSYERYGARGISVCEEWRTDFVTFREWALSHGYRRGLTIDRVDNSGGYTPDNCRWTTTTEQNTNKRNTRKVEYRGEIVPTSVLAHEHGLHVEILRGRIFRLGWDIERALNTPVRRTTTAATREHSNSRG